ncbi:MAG: hypothetical protein H0W67_03955 [Gemmatimonadales bacterium]|nr:hypothetical protein [Gemmatimonadales bacterium]
MVEPPVEPDGLFPEVVSITLHLREQNGTLRDMETDMAGIDAIFLSRPAIIKFLVAMYMATGNEDSADRVRQEHDLKSAGTARVLIKHNQYCGYSLVQL